MKGRNNHLYPNANYETMLNVVLLPNVLTSQSTFFLGSQLFSLHFLSLDWMTQGKSIPQLMH